MANIGKLNGEIPYNLVRGNHDVANTFIERYTIDTFAANGVNGEEYGLYGSDAFMNEFKGYNNVVDRIKFGTNLESRGSAGTLIMFETAKNNYNTVKLFSEINKNIFTCSIATMVYDMMPNSTDFTNFKEVYQGINMANILGGENYHTQNDNFENIHDGLGLLGAEMLVEIIPQLQNGTATRTPQNHELSSYAKKITKEDCLVDFSKDAKTVHNQIRGLSPFPLSFTHTPNGKLLKLIDSKIVNNSTPHECVGKILSLDGGIEIACAVGSVYIDRVLPEGKARMSAADFIRGRNISVGDILK